MGSGRRGTEHRQVERSGVPDPVILELRYRPPESGPDGTAGDGAPEKLSRADLARQVNSFIYKAAQSSGYQEDAEFTFVCACGCLAEVTRSLRDYVAIGAIVTGHARPAGH
jgi:hypothetical protein